MTGKMISVANDFDVFVLFVIFSLLSIILLWSASFCAQRYKRERNIRYLVLAIINGLGFLLISFLALLLMKIVWF